jgi:hypothetical protein
MSFSMDDALLQVTDIIQRTKDEFLYQWYQQKFCHHQASLYRDGDTGTA